jgi:hypothetical protein
MMVLVERYVSWLNRQKLTGDVVAEPRFKKVEKQLKDAFSYIYNHGTPTTSAKVIQRCLTSRELKFENKSANIAAMQLVDLIAHPSYYGTRQTHTKLEMRESFGTKIYSLLISKKYARHPASKKIDGWGQKWLP